MGFYKMLKSYEYFNKNIPFDGCALLIYFGGLLAQTQRTRNNKTSHSIDFQHVHNVFSGKKFCSFFSIIATNDEREHPFRRCNDKVQCKI